MQTTETKKYSPAPDVIAAVLTIGYWYWLTYSKCKGIVERYFDALSPEPFVTAGSVTGFILEIVLLYVLLRGVMRSGQYLFGDRDEKEPNSKLVGKHWIRFGICVVLLLLIGFLVRDDGSEGCYDPESVQRLLEQIQSFSEETEEISSVIPKSVITSTVFLAVVDGGDLIGRASGVIVNEEGTVITNKHVVFDENDNFYDSILVIPTDENEMPNRNCEWSAQTVFAPDFTDLAMLTAPDKLPCPIHNHLSPTNIIPQTGEEIRVIGYPGIRLGGMSITTTKGQIAGKIQGDDGIRFLKTDAKIITGTSGGAVINKANELVGIATALVYAEDELGESDITQEIIGLIVPSTHVHSLLSFDLNVAEVEYQKQMQERREQNVDSNREEIMMEKEDVIRRYFDALSSGDALAAYSLSTEHQKTKLHSPEIIAAISESMIVPMTLIIIVPTDDPNAFWVTYRYQEREKPSCNSTAKVIMENVNGEWLVDKFLLTQETCKEI